MASVRSLTVHYGDYIDGLQVTYVLQDDQAMRGAWHGGTGGNATHRVKFGGNEVIVRVEGYSKFGPPNGFLTQLNFFTKDSSGKIHKYGPIGEQSTKYRFLFNFAGVVIGFFGESGDYLNGIGFEYDNSIVQPYYKKTPLTGGGERRHFDDNLPILGPLKMIHMTIDISAIESMLTVSTQPICFQMDQRYPWYMVQFMSQSMELVKYNALILYRFC